VEVKENKIGEVCSTHKEDKKCKKIINGKHNTWGTHTQDCIKRDLTKIKCSDVDWT
jgi:hypothetical protein